MQARWRQGFWLGVRWETGEQLVMHADDGFVYRARSIEEHLRDLSMSDLLMLKSSPHDPQGILKEGGRGAQPLEPDQARDDDAYFAQVAPKRVPITREIVNRAGPTIGCKQCRDMLNNCANEKNVHSEACRARMEA